ncbi:helicase associated domain-containing protein [Streptomyces sp. NPDC059755]|uniref:helicase associated domain-containing protein n=1 Tax=Streptomyces sp. NPDC059755 TaxID=3346934 RepID=UPI0036542109
MVANWVSFNVIDTERHDWARGWAALKRYVERVGDARVPYEHREGAVPLGEWVAEQRRAYEAGQLLSQRAERLEQLGMVWSRGRGVPGESGGCAGLLRAALDVVCSAYGRSSRQAAPTTAMPPAMNNSSRRAVRHS